MRSMCAKSGQKRTEILGDYNGSRTHGGWWTCEVGEGRATAAHWPIDQKVAV